MPNQSRRAPTRFHSTFPQAQPRRAPASPLPVSTFRFLRLPLPEVSDEALILTLYAAVIGGYYGHYQCWPWLCAPGTTGGIEVV